MLTYISIPIFRFTACHVPKFSYHKKKNLAHLSDARGYKAESLFVGFQHFSRGYPIVLTEKTDEIARMGIAHHPCDIMNGVLPFFQQHLCGFHPLLHDIFIDR